MKKIVTLLLSLCLMLCVGGVLTACGGDDSSDMDMIQVAPTSVDIGHDGPLEVTAQKAFEVQIRLGWENWEYRSDTAPDSTVYWSQTSGNYVDAQYITSDVVELDGWLIHYITYSILLQEEGTTTLTVTARGQTCSDSIEITVIAGENNGDTGNNGEHASCPEEKLELELVGDHYVVTGIGTYELGSVDIGNYYDEAKALNIYNEPNGIPITEIADGAFSGVELTHFGSSTVTKIGDRAFENCLDLQAISIESQNAISIGAYAFAGCTNLENVISYASVQNIGEYAFAGLTKLNCWNHRTGVFQFSFENGATINAHAFEGCTSLTELLTNYDLEDLTVGEYAFANCTGLTLIQDFRATEVCAHAFENCYNITNSTPNSLTKIGEYAFAGCEQLRSVECADTVEIGDYAFLVKDRSINGTTVRNTMLVSVYLYGGATKIGVQAFKGNVKLEVVDSQGGIDIICEEAFYGCKGMYEFSVESTVGEVQARAFSACGSEVNDYYVNLGYKYLKYHVTGGTKILRNGAMSGAFLSELDLSKTELIEGKLTFGGEVRLVLPSYYTEIPDGMFEGCTGLYGIVFTSQITKIGSRAFVGCNLSDADFKLPDSVTRIEAEAFRGCSLTNGELPSSLTYIGERAFYGEKNFVNTTVYLPATLTEICESAFAESSVIKVAAAQPLSDTFRYADLIVWRNTFQNCKALQEVDLTSWDRSEDGLAVSENMFDGCSKLTVVNLGYVSYVGAEAFKGCSSLTSFRLIPTNDAGEYYENTATGFQLSANGQQTIRLTLNMLADAEAMAANVRSGMYDRYAWNAWKL